MQAIETEQKAQPYHLKEQLLQPVAWSRWQQWLIRVSTIFFLLLLIPLDRKWYERLFEATYFYEILSPFTGYRPDFFEVHSESGRWGFLSYSTWFVALAIALTGASIWTILQRKSALSYDKWYYWLRVLVRYRIAIGIIDFGYLKLFPMQMPYPSIANLNTDFGDYTLYKLYWQSVGIVTWYEIVLGVVEVFGGFLLFFRQTASLGAVINIGVLFNIAFANHAYDGGVHVYSAFFVLLSLFVLTYDFPSIYKLLIKEQDVQLRLYHPRNDPSFRTSWWLTSKIFFIFLFVLLLGYYRYDRHYNQRRLKDPIEQGLNGVTGFYQVDRFKFNGKELTLNTPHLGVWQAATFERWSTLGIKTGDPQPIPLENGTPQPKDLDRSYELAGVAGGWKYYYYQVDTTNKELKLWNKAIHSLAKKKNENKELLQKPLVWKYSFLHPNRIRLHGLDEEGNEIDVNLVQVERSYPLIKGLKQKTDFTIQRYKSLSIHP
ncbi:hypothetical protein RYH73_07455 [Olivibacter sp. CPCC 100613]|uniref:hypothetical protein n=1 Tax=Olivibacter sp. CPCC 100613 TaxID=3079931 RepID=UPI002FF97520